MITMSFDKTLYEQNRLAEYRVANLLNKDFPKLKAIVKNDYSYDIGIYKGEDLAAVSEVQGYYYFAADDRKDLEHPDCYKCPERRIKKTYSKPCFVWLVDAFAENYMYCPFNKLVEAAGKVEPVSEMRNGEWEKIYYLPITIFKKYKGGKNVL